MNKRILACGHFLLIILLVSVSSRTAHACEGTDAGLNTAEFAEQHIKQLRTTAVVFRRLVRQPLPAKLSADQRKEEERFNQWLQECVGKLDDLANRWQTALVRTSAGTGTAGGTRKGRRTDRGSQDQSQQDTMAQMEKMQEMNQSFNLQYLMLQQHMQDESRRFSLLSNIMKEKHDTAKNSIGNLR